MVWYQISNFGKFAFLGKFFNSIEQVLIFLCRVISRAPGLKIVVETLIHSLVPIGNLLIVGLVFFTIFGILGVQVITCITCHIISLYTMLHFITYYVVYYIMLHVVNYYYLLHMFLYACYILYCVALLLSLLYTSYAIESCFLVYLTCHITHFNMLHVMLYGMLHVIIFSNILSFILYSFSKGNFITVLA